MTPECEYCSAPATRRVEAQWTVLDFDYIDTCVDHEAAALRTLRARRIDDQLPADVWVHVWEPQP
jgi:hypothetical protein